MARVKKTTNSEIDENVEIVEVDKNTGTDGVVKETVEEVKVIEENSGEGSGVEITPQPLNKIFVLDKVNVCSVKDSILTLANPVIVVKDEETMAIVEALVKTGKLKEL